MNQDIQKIYDFCEQKKNALDQGTENTDDFNAKMMLTNQSTVYWAIQQFILVNFEENKTDEEKAEELEQMARTLRKNDYFVTKIPEDIGEVAEGCCGTGRGDCTECDCFACLIGNAE